MAAGSLLAILHSVQYSYHLLCCQGCLLDSSESGHLCCPGSPDCCCLLPAAVPVVVPHSVLLHLAAATSLLMCSSEPSQENTFTALPASRSMCHLHRQKAMIFPRWTWLAGLPTAPSTDFPATGSLSSPRQLSVSAAALFLVSSFHPLSPAVLLLLFISE